MEQSNEKKQTAMMQAMSKFAAHKEKATTFRDVIYLDGVLAILETLLEVERAQIETSFDDGVEDEQKGEFGGVPQFTCGKQYFTQTFKSE